MTDTAHSYSMSPALMKRKSVEVLCDNQSACDIKEYLYFIVNICGCMMTLILKSQARTCEVTHISDLPGVVVF